MTPPPVPVPVEPCAWQFPTGDAADEHGIVAVGADLRPSTLIEAYRNGLFPMPITEVDHLGEELIGWWSPPERGVLELDQLRVSRSLRRSCRRFTVTVNADFDAVIGACATAERDGGWISPGIRSAYRELHRLGWAHSVEVWHDGHLVGGLYGVQVAGLFAGESMFHTMSDASKVALVALVSALQDVGAMLVDTQWQTDHLASLGVSRVTRRSYHAMLRQALVSRTPSLASRQGTDWVTNSPYFLDRTAKQPMDSNRTNQRPATS